MNALLILTLVLAAAQATPTRPAKNAATSPATTTTAAAAAKDDELVEAYVEATETAQKRFADEIAAAKKARDEKIAKAEKAFAAERDKATEKYLTTAEKASAKYAESLKVAIAATVAAYDGKIARTRRVKDEDQAASVANAKQAFEARARRDHAAAVAAARTLAGVATSASGEPTTVAVERGAVIADHIVAVVDDFIIDVYHNGQKVHDSSRRLLDEIHGATVERIDIEVRGGDWVVFNVANNRLRWGGQSLFMAAGKLNEDGPPVFVTLADDKHWSSCDDPGEVKKFIADRAHLSDRAAKPPETPWGEGVARFNQLFPESAGQPIWGESRNTWIKFVAE